MITKQEIKEAETPAEAAALWWVSALRDPKHDNGSGDPMLLALTAWARHATHEPSAVVLDQFKANLVERLNNTLNDADSPMARYGITLDVDYGPNMILSECADSAGFRGDIVNWPWKTTMLVKPDEVSVRYGYHGELEVIWTKRS